MGQAKARGTLEQRVAEGLKKSAIEKESRDAAEKELARKRRASWNALPDKEKKRHVELQSLLATVVGLCASTR